MSTTAKALRNEAAMIVRTFDPDASITAAELADTLLRIAADIEPREPETIGEVIGRIHGDGGVMIAIRFARGSYALEMGWKDDEPDVVSRVDLGELAALVAKAKAHEAEERP